MKTARMPQPAYTGPLPSSEDLDRSCSEVMETALPVQLCALADDSTSLRALLEALFQTCKQLKAPRPFTEYQGYNLIRGILIGILAERRRRNRGIQ